MATCPHPVRPAYHPHRLDALMDEFDLSNRGLAVMVEPADESRMNALRQRIIAWRKGTRMTEESAARILPALNTLREVTLEELLILEDIPPVAEAQLEELLVLVQEIRAEQSALQELVQRLRRELDERVGLEGSLVGGSRVRRAT